MPVASKKKSSSARPGGAASKGAMADGSIGTQPDEDVKPVRMPSAKVRMEKLTQAEFEVLDALAVGLSPKEIAWERGTSVATVRTQIKMAKKKAQARTLSELVAVFCLAHKRYP